MVRDVLPPSTYTIHMRAHFVPPLTGSSIHTLHQKQTNTVTILTVSKPVEYAMAGIIGLTCLFLLVNMFFLVRYRTHKVRASRIAPPTYYQH